MDNIAALPFCRHNASLWSYNIHPRPVNFGTYERDACLESYCFRGKLNMILDILIFSQFNSPARPDLIKINGYLELNYEEENMNFFKISFRVVFISDYITLWKSLFVYILSTYPLCIRR